jgi:hypothetical protein
MNIKPFIRIYKMTSVAELKQLKTQIEKLDKANQIDILKILRDSNNVFLNENKSGVYINLTYCPQNTIDEITKYLDYTTEQEHVLNTIEQEKNNVKTEYFNNFSTI